MSLISFAIAAVIVAATAVVALVLAARRPAADPGIVEAEATVRAAMAVQEQPRLALRLAA